MNDKQYLAKKAALEAAKNLIATTEDEVTEEAKARGEAFTLHAWYYGGKVDWAFLALEEALGRAEDDCSPIHILAPDGTKLDPWTGKPA